MKSVFKSVAPMALAITVALSGVAMAETVAPAAKSADSAAAQPAIQQPAQATKAVEHHHKLKESKTEVAAPVTLASTASTTPAAGAAVQKSTPAAEVKKAVEPAKTQAAAKVESGKVEASKAEPVKTK